MGSTCPVRVPSREVVGTNPVVASRLLHEKGLTFQELEGVVCIEYPDCSSQEGLLNDFRCRLHTRLALPMAEPPV